MRTGRGPSGLAENAPDLINLIGSTMSIDIFGGFSKVPYNPSPMNYRREFINQWLAFALSLSVCGLSLGCIAICANHSERSCGAPDETSVALTGQEDGCCPLDALRSAPPDRIQKTPAGHITRPLAPAGISGIYRRQRLNLLAGAPQPASSPPLQRLPTLRI